jgi:hypothetical protein
MVAVIVLLAVLALLVAMAYAGYRDGLYAATYALVRSVIGFLCAMTFCQPLASFLTGVISREDPMPQYFIPISFIGIFGIVLAIGRWLKVTYTDPGVACPASVDRVAGPIVGLLHAVVFTGTLLVFWSLLPFAKFVPADMGHVNTKLGSLDTGATMLKFYDFATGRMAGDAPFLLQDEPVQGQTQPGAPPAPGQSFVDVNGNGKWDRGWLWKYRHYADIDESVLPAPAAGAAPAAPAGAPAPGGAPAP